MKKDDFVIATQPINGIVIKSVGIVKSIFQGIAQVYFIGKNEDVMAPFDSLSVTNVEETGDRGTEKICIICHVRKPIEEFEKNQTNSKGEAQRRPSCKGCRKVITGKKMRAAERRRMDAKRPPDKTIFVCPICEKRSIVSINVVIVPDHNHRTGKGREWLCESCNTGLGRFKDDITFAEKVVKYLKQFEDDESEESDSISQISLDL